MTLHLPAGHPVLPAFFTLLAAVAERNDARAAAAEKILAQARAAVADAETKKRPDKS